MVVDLIRTPTGEDWARAYKLALGTEGKETDVIPSDIWRASLIKSEHSPLRTIMYTVGMYDIPYYVAMHLVRHKIGVEWYVKTQRNDRQNDYDRRAARQDTFVNLIMDANLQAIINIGRRRLCDKADVMTQMTWRQVLNAIVDNELSLKVRYAIEIMSAPPCGNCKEFKPCRNIHEVVAKSDTLC